MSDRITGFVVAVLALAFFASASQLEQPFFADPLGPKAFPMVVAGVAMVAAILMIIKPDAEPNWPAFAVLGRIAIATLILVIYAYGLKPPGFLLPTALAAGAVSYQIDPKFSNAAKIGIGLSGGLFVIFKFGLGLSLFALPRWMMG